MAQGWWRTEWDVYWSCDLPFETLCNRQMCCKNKAGDCNLQERPNQISIQLVDVLKIEKVHCEKRYIEEHNNSDTIDVWLKNSQRSIYIFDMRGQEECMLKTAQSVEKLLKRTLMVPESVITVLCRTRNHLELREIDSAIVANQGSRGQDCFQSSVHILQGLLHMQLQISTKSTESNKI